MRILLTNDDGINAPGLVSLEKIARQLSDDIWIVAPEWEQSGASHSLTLADPLRLREIEDRRFEVSGTPSDSVLLAVRKVMPAMPDLILSGVNRGQNIADDVGYSGTVAGAIEGTLLDVPSIALSQAYQHGERARIPWETAEAHAPGIIRKLIEFGFPEAVLYNINFPNRAPDKVDGVAVTSQGKLSHRLHIDERFDGRGNQYFWLAYRPEKNVGKPGTDIEAMEKGVVSVTALRLDLTAYDLAVPLGKHLARAE